MEPGWKGQSCFQDMEVHREYAEDTWGSEDPGREDPGHHLGPSAGH